MVLIFVKFRDIGLEEKRAPLLSSLMVFEFFQPCALSNIKNIFERQVFRIKSYFCYDNSFIQ